MSMGGKIKEIRNSKGMTLKDVSALTGMSMSFVSDIEHDRSEPSIKTLFKLAHALNVSAPLLLDEYQQSHRKGEDDIKAIKDFVIVPVLGQVSCGTPIYADENIITYRRVPEEQVRDGNYFYLIVKGDSMTGAQIHPGSSVLIRRQDYIEDGQIALVLLDCEEAVLKRVFKTKDGLVLQSDNPSYQPVVTKEARILGRAVKVENDL